MIKENITKAYTEKDFVKEYEQLCEKMGYRINVNPVFISRDDGTWSVKLNAFTEKLLPQKIDK